MENYKCGGYVFNAKFDSGNLASVELVHLHEDTSACDQIISTEFNVHTRPDCAGTLWENQNRSWFFFSIHGGEPAKICKINVVNMNKQAKLFGQGMHPVVRVGETGKWERVKDHPVSHMNADQFCMSFLHKPHPNCSPAVPHYYAFTYPFTYADCQNQLSAYADTHQKSTVRVNYVIQRLLAPPAQKSHAVVAIDPLAGDTAQLSSASSPSSSPSPPPPKIPSVGTRLGNMSRSELESEIYFHRELLVHSVEGRRVDLLTISSFAGIQLERELRLDDLFPDTRTVRCNRFRGKQVIFVSSRVHPGETPASHVLNGFLKLLLDVHSLVGAALRKKYVFKIVPFLNPDGVYQGCYRSDTLGHNLNRVYQNPSLQTQPTIYAVRKLVRYYHFNVDVPDARAKQQHHQLEELIATDADDRVDGVPSNTTQLSQTDGCFIVPPPPPALPAQRELNLSSTEFIVLADVLCSTDSSTAQSSDSECGVADTTKATPSTTTTSTSKSANHESAASSSDSSSATCPSTTASDRDLPAALQPTIDEPVADDRNVVVLAAPDHKAGRVFHDQLVPVIKPILIEGSAGVHMKKPVWSKGEQQQQQQQQQQNHHHRQRASAASASARNTITGYPGRVARDGSASAQTSAATHQPLINAKFRITKRRNTACSAAADRQNNNADVNNAMLLDDDTVEGHAAALMNNSRSAGGAAGAAAPLDNGNLFLYIDLHGHASKKGIFMYGNHMSTTAEAVECMLLPRLMSMNCHHFHFDSCVFSERNMYSTGKRDGLSKEGSGRVAIYKSTGLIKCYTLEGNYNTGKYVNVLPPRGKDPVSRKSNLPVPKYSPLIFEEVGRALGPSILDLTGANPMSRIQNSDFKSVQGMRNALRVELERVNPRSLVFNSAAPSNKSVGPIKRTKKSKAKQAAAAAAAAALAVVAGAGASTSTAKLRKHKPPTLQPKKSQPQPFKENKLQNTLATIALKAPPRHGCTALLRPMPVHFCGVLPTAEVLQTRLIGEPAAFVTTAASTSKANTSHNAAAASSTASTSSSGGGIEEIGGIVGKRKTLKVRPKCAVESGVAAGGVSAKKLKRCYSSKDSLRLKRKKKKLPKGGDAAGAAIASGSAAAADAGDAVASGSSSSSSSSSDARPATAPSTMLCYPRS